MRNPYLEWADSFESWRQHRGHQEPADPPLSEDIEFLAAEWWQRQRSQPTQSEFPSPPWDEKIRATTPREVLEGIESLLGGHHRAGDIPNTAQRLAGRALAHALAGSSPDISSLKLIYEHEDITYEFINAFEVVFIRLLGSKPDRKQAWLEVLLKCQEFTPSPRYQGPPGANTKAAIEALRQEWEAETDPFSVWSWVRERWEVEPGSFLAAWMRLLFTLDPRSWLNGINDLPLPALVHSALRNPRLRDDGELLLSLVEIAPPLFASDGRWTRSVVILLLLDVALLHVEHVYSEVSRRQLVVFVGDSKMVERQKEAEAKLAAAEQDLSAWLKEVYRLLVARLDGIQIAIRLDERLIWQLLNGRLAKHGWWSRQEAVHSLTGALATAGVSVAGIYQTWKALEQSGPRSATSNWPAGMGEPEDRHGDGARTLRTLGLPFLLTASELTEGRLPVGVPISSVLQAERQLLWPWLLELLQGHDLGFLLIAQENYGNDTGWWIQWAYNKLAFILEGTPDVADALAQGLQSLEPQRRRMQFHYPSLRHAWRAGGSEILLRSGQYLCARQTNSNGLSMHLRKIFLWTFTELHQLYLTAPLAKWHARFDLIRNFLGESFAFAPGMCGDDLTEALQVMVPLIAGDSRLVDQAYRLCGENGSNPGLLAEIFRQLGADPDQAGLERSIWEPDPNLRTS